MRYLAFLLSLAGILWSASGRTASTDPALAPQVPAEELMGATPLNVMKTGDVRGLVLNLPLVLDQYGASGAIGMAVQPMHMHLWERGFDRGKPWHMSILNGLSFSFVIADVPIPGTPEDKLKAAATATYDLINQRDPLRVARTKDPTNVVTLGAGMTNDFGQLWASYGLDIGRHGWTVKVLHRLAQKRGPELNDLGLRYTLLTAAVSPSIDTHLELMPHDGDILASDVRVSGGTGLTFAFPEGLSLTVGTRLISPYLVHDQSDPIVRGFVSLGWGGYDLNAK